MSVLNYFALVLLELGPFCFFVMIKRQCCTCVLLYKLIYTCSLLLLYFVDNIEHHFCLTLSWSKDLLTWHRTNHIGQALPIY